MHVGRTRRDVGQTGRRVLESGIMAPPRVLVVDDDADVRRLYATALRTRYDVKTAESGPDARTLLQGTRYELVLLDLHMPVVDGFEILSDLAAREHPNHDVPVLVVTADVTDEARSRAIRHRGVYCLSKPVPIAVLLRVVASTLERAAAKT